MQTETPEWATWATDGHTRWARIRELTSANERADFGDDSAWVALQKEVSDLRRAAARDSGAPVPDWMVEDSCLRLGFTPPPPTNWS